MRTAARLVWMVVGAQHRRAREATEEVVVQFDYQFRSEGNTETRRRAGRSDLHHGGLQQLCGEMEHGRTSQGTYARRVRSRGVSEVIGTHV